jgi:hypothetical protein
MKVVDIKGKRSYVKFILEDGSCILGSGELLTDGFCVYMDSLSCNEELLADTKKESLKEAVSEFLKGRTFKVDFA